MDSTRLLIADHTGERERLETCPWRACEDEFVGEITRLQIEHNAGFAFPDTLTSREREGVAWYEQYSIRAREARREIDSAPALTLEDLA